jgi:transposase-like protein
MGGKPNNLRKWKIKIGEGNGKRFKKKKVETPCSAQDLANRQHKR